MDVECWRLLLVDDDAVHVRFVHLALDVAAPGQFRVTVAGDLDAARRLARKATFDVVLLDLAAVAGEPPSGPLIETGDPALVVLAERGDASVMAAALRRGAQEVLVKGEGDGTTLVRSLRLAIERKQLARRLERLAYHDPLTGLANRALLVERLERALLRTTRCQGLVAVVFLDLDGFKLVNDLAGHATGDALLVEIGRHLAAVVRRTDTVARFGGDEFAVLLDGIAAPGDAARVARKLVAAIGHRLEVDKVSRRLQASAGVAVAPYAGPDARTLLANADVAMYRAKAEGGAGVVMFSRSVEAGAESSGEAGRRRPYAALAQGDRRLTA